VVRDCNCSAVPEADECSTGHAGRRLRSDGTIESGFTGQPQRAGPVRKVLHRAAHAGTAERVV